MIRFIMLTTQRSGATFFLKYLSQHPQINCRHETIFTQDSKFKFFSVDRPSSFYFKYRTGSIRRQFAHWFWRKQLIHDCLEDYLNTVSNNAKAVGLKVSYNQIEKYPAISAWIQKSDVRIIHLVRNNVLKTLLSSETAKRRGLYHSVQKVESIRIYLHPEKLRSRLKRRVRLIQKYREMYANKQYLEVSYESFVANMDVEIRRVLGFLEVDLIMPPAPDLIKINPNSIENMIENFDDVFRVLEGTVFEKYLVN